jgi:L-ribulose-5-phosphate 3-epimerase
MRIGVFLPLDNHIEDHINKASDMGFKSCQLYCFKPEFYSNDLVDRISSISRELKFEITAFFAGWSGYHSFAYPDMYRTIGLIPVYLREKRTKDILEGADFAYKLGIKNVFTHIGYLPDDPLNKDRLEIKDILAYIADILAKRGQNFQIETGEMLPLSLVQLIKDIGRENVGVNFDPANFLINGRANPLDALDLLGPYVRGVHAKDAVYPIGTNPKGKETPLGHGFVNFELLIKKLISFGYCGDLTIEREITGDEQIRDIKLAKKHLEEILEKIKRSDS